jgi:hypothetical protein
MLTFESEACTIVVLIIYIGPPKVFSFFFGPLPKKFAHHWYISYRFVDSFQAGPGWNSCSSDRAS